ncbi:MAG TPA: PEP-CTERM sorting domain-containing protein [Bryobacteraceae bacterium]|nr:PEP-CTERM sorting domain-containing protein [Bryobacteraceae bacterium]
MSALLLMGSSGLASAAVVLVTPCSAFEAPNSGPTASSACSATADPGFFIDSVTFTITSDYTGYQSGNPVVTDIYTFATNTAGFGAVGNGVVTTTGTNSNPIQNFNVTLSGNFGSSVTESFNLSNTVSGGSVTATSGVGRISATESPIGGNVPEPGSLGLIGSALVGLGLFFRRQRI